MQTQIITMSDRERRNSEESRQQQAGVLDKEQLFASARPRLLRVARLRGVPPDALEDVIQETLFVAWKKFDSLHTFEYIHPWLDAICRNVCARYIRASSQEALRQMPLFDEPLLTDEYNEIEFFTRNSEVLSPDPAEMLDQQELYDLLRQALNLLPPAARAAVETYYLLELPQREAAVRLGLSISALETRLYRARHQLREILGGHLREQAASLNLPLDEEPASSWRETGIWCYYCGQQKLHGFFETLPDGKRYLRMRCPECSRRFENDIVNGKGLVNVENLRSFQPAFKRTMRGVSHHLLQAISTGTLACKYCGKSALIRVNDLKERLQSTSGRLFQRHFWISGHCPHCGNKIGGFSADDAVYWSRPEIQAFIQRYPRWLNEPDLPIEYEGQPAILFRLSDSMSAAQLHVITHRQTLQMLATFSH